MSKHDDTLSLFLSNRAALVRYAETIVGSAAEAEDVVQEAWLRFSASAASRSLAEPMGYLRMIVRNLAINGINRKRLEARIFEPDGEDAAAAVPSELPTPEAAAISRDEYARIVAALREMPEPMRLAVEMHRLGGEKLKTIAARLGVSVSTAHTLVLDGIERCRARTGRPSS